MSQETEQHADNAEFSAIMDRLADETCKALHSRFEGAELNWPVVSRILKPYYATRIERVKRSRPLFDGRGRTWFVHAQVWAATNNTDGYDRLLMEGSVRKATLPEIAAWFIQGLAELYGEVPEGMSITPLEHKLKNLRVSIARNNGRARMWVEYTEPTTGLPAQIIANVMHAEHEADWLAEREASRGAEYAR